MTTLTEALHPGAFIVAEADNFHCRESVQIALSQTLKSGHVIGRTALVAGVTSSVTADAGNTGGSGVLTLDPTTPVAAGAKNGNYRVVCIEPVSAGGNFAVFDPDGTVIGHVLVGATFDNQIKFTLSDATDFVAGDAFTVVVGIERSDFDYLALDLTAAAGAQHSAGILVGGIVTDGTTKKKAAALVRGPAQVLGSALTWPAGITAAQKAAEIAKLEFLGIIVR